MRFVRLAVVLVAMATVGVATSVASASHQGSVVPMFCTTHTIPAGTELVLRLGWAAKNYDQSTLFLGAQNLTWTVTRSDGSAVSRPGPSPTYGDTSNWSAPVYQEAMIDGKRQKTWFTNYQTPTGVVVGLNETVTVTYGLTVDRNVLDGFGYKLTPGVTLGSGNTCSVTGV
jgi:hypothetical protein